MNTNPRLSFKISNLGRLASLVGLLLFLLLSGAFGTLIGWPTFTKPKITLEEALAKANATVNAQAEYYCLGAALYASEEYPPTKCSWTLRFATEDFKERVVQVDQDGECRITSEYSPHTAAKRPRLASLDEVKNRLTGFFQEEGYQFETQSSPASLEIKSAMRKFQIHPREGTGEFGDKLEMAEGPGAQGFRLSFELLPITNESRSSWIDTPYWINQVATFSTSGGENFILMNAQWGRDYDYGQVGRIINLLGEKFSHF